MLEHIMIIELSSAVRPPSSIASSRRATWANCSMKNWFTFSQSAPSEWESRWWIM